MKKRGKLFLLIFLLLLGACTPQDTAPPSPSTPISTSTDEGDESEKHHLTGGNMEAELSPQVEEAYLALLSGDTSLLADVQVYQYWVGLSHQGELEYTALDLDGDGVSELLMQCIDNPGLYNAVFHYEDGKLFCWNNDGMETSCRDYPLKDGTMVRQYDYSGNRTYTLFRYQSDGTYEERSSFAALEGITYDDAASYPCYTVAGEAVDKAVFDAQFQALIDSQRLERSAWTAYHQQKA